MSLDFFKKHKIFSAFLILIIILIAILLIYLISVRVGIPKERNYVSYMKGVWEPALPYFIAKDMKRIKEDNINIVSLGPIIHAPNLVVKILRQPLIGVIKEAKKEGIAIHIAPQAFGPGPPDPDNLDDETLEEYTSKILEWAEFSEKYGVEYFSPLNEPNIVMHSERAIEWQNNLLPKIRKVFSGKIIAKWAGADIEHIQASKDFDGVMFDIFPPDKEEELEEFYIELEDTVKITSQEAKKLNLTIAIGEFAIPVYKPERVAEIMPGFIVSEEEQAEFTAKYLDIVMPYYDGVIYCGWSVEGYGIKEKPVEQVIKEKFAEE